MRRPKAAKTDRPNPKIAIRTSKRAQSEGRRPRDGESAITMEAWRNAKMKGTWTARVDPRSSLIRPEGSETRTFEISKFPGRVSSRILKVSMRRSLLILNYRDPIKYLNIVIINCYRYSIRREYLAENMFEAGKLRVHQPEFRRRHRPGTPTQTSPDGTS